VLNPTLPIAGLMLSLVCIAFIGSADATHNNIEYKIPKITNTAIWSPNCIDVDQDGVCDSWEDSMDLKIINPDTGVLAYKYTCGLIPKSNSPDTSKGNPDNIATYSGDWVGCPGPDKRDIFVEVDWMDGHYPDIRALIDVQRAFLYHHNIRLHIQLDEKALFAASSPTDRNYKTYFPGSDRLWGFDQIKSAHFGTPIERLDPKWLNSGAAGEGWIAKKQVFHYALFVKRYAGDLQASGIGEVWGNDFMISLGAFDGGVGSRDQQAATFMHELGHNLGLNHGGASNDPMNCKPHYLSVMNYAYQFKNFDTSRPLEYSRAAPTLDGSTSLTERNPREDVPLSSYPSMPDGTPAQRNIVFGPTNPPPLPLKKTGEHMDWDRNPNRVINSNTSPAVDIPGLNELAGCNTAATLDTYSSYNDNINLKLRFAHSTNAWFASGAGAIEDESEWNHILKHFEALEGSSSNPSDIRKSLMPTEITQDDVIKQRVARINAFEKLMEEIFKENPNSVTPVDYNDGTDVDPRHVEMTYPANMPTASLTYIQLSTNQPDQKSQDVKNIPAKPERGTDVTKKSDSDLESTVFQTTSEARKLLQNNDVGGATNTLHDFRENYDKELKNYLSKQAYDQYKINIDDIIIAYSAAFDYCNPCKPIIEEPEFWFYVVLGIAVGLAIALIIVLWRTRKPRSDETNNGDKTATDNGVYAHAEQGKGKKTAPKGL
jgi:hypothetical protein